MTHKRINIKIISNNTSVVPTPLATAEMANRHRPSRPSHAVVGSRKLSAGTSAGSGTTGL